MTPVCEAFKYYMLPHYIASTSHSGLFQAPPLTPIRLPNPQMLVNKVEPFFPHHYISNWGRWEEVEEDVDREAASIHQARCVVRRSSITLQRRSARRAAEEENDSEMGNKKRSVCVCGGGGGGGDRERGRNTSAKAISLSGTGENEAEYKDKCPVTL